MFIGLSSLNRWLGISCLDHDSLLIIKVSNQVKTFLGISLSVQFLSSLKLFINLLRTIQEIYVHLSLLSHNFSIRSMLLLREIEANRKIKRSDLGLHHALHIHHAWVLHVWVLRLHKMLHATSHHQSGVHSSCSSSHHHFLGWSSHSHSHPHLHSSSHHHLVVRVPHLCLYWLVLLDDIYRHREKTKLTTICWGLLLWLRLGWHHWRRVCHSNSLCWGTQSKFLVTVSK